MRWHADSEKQTKRKGDIAQFLDEQANSIDLPLTAGIASLVQDHVLVPIGEYHGSYEESTC